jgi:plasmid stabilization system protein ParE
MALTIFWTKRADKKFDSIISYLVTEFGEITASDFIKKVYEFLDLLAKFPEMGTLENKELHIRAFVIVRQITIFYNVQKDKIIILNFYDNRQKPKQKRF